MLLLIWVLNLVISAFNAWGCGKTWNESKANGGLPHFMNWMGAIMSASGFTWCYMVIAAYIGSAVPLREVDGHRVPLLTSHMVDVFCNLGYLMIIFPIIGAGIAITVHSWGVFWRRRTFGNGAIAGYNTFADAYNIYNAVRYVPGASRSVGNFFSGKDSDSDSDSQGIVLALVLICLAGGILTTWAIIKSVAKSTAFDRAQQYGTV